MQKTAVNVITLDKGTEKFIYVYRDGDCPEVIKAMRDAARSGNFNFSWDDARALIARVRSTAYDGLEFPQLK